LIYYFLVCFALNPGTEISGKEKILKEQITKEYANLAFFSKFLDILVQLDQAGNSILTR